MGLHDDLSHQSWDFGGPEQVHGSCTHLCPTPTSPASSLSPRSGPLFSGHSDLMTTKIALWILRQLVLTRCPWAPKSRCVVNIFTVKQVILLHSNFWTTWQIDCCREHSCKYHYVIWMVIRLVFKMYISGWDKIKWLLLCFYFGFIAWMMII